ncbi:hypothetical protein [Sphingobium limneticum]|uniref:Uncharacterized protein n=1 Tax=Sphingobium limneticum TaxID=1007511 RepID=A0A5J5I658_9SPHN|nr:hypothetical protein [Sphingobium limneticum]KAA9018294.1 hypothetical protein F4U96_09285 [Sphingobium limneticum]KAA9030930.1 hypothetical protein F4U95_09235 [Sphingobium limneticum]
MTEQTTTTTDALDEDTSGLKAKNADLVKRLAAAQKRAEDAEREKTEAEENAANEKRSDLEKANKQIEKLTKDLATANGATADATKALHSYKAETEIGKLLVSHKVQPDDAPMVTAYIKSLMAIDDDGNPTFEGSDAATFGKAYFTGAGKRYTAAPDNSGGGSTGFDGTKAPRMTADNMNWSELAKIHLNNPEEARAIATAAGKDIG